MDELHYCETVMVFNDAGQYVRGYVDGHPPEDPAALVAVNAPTPEADHAGNGWAVVMRPRSEIYLFSLARYVEGKKGNN